MRQYDWEIALAAWLLSLAACYFWQPAILLVIATTFNVWDQRHILYNAGTKFVERVRETLAGDLTSMGDRIAKMEADVADIKESQIRMQGAFRGKNLP